MPDLFAPRCCLPPRLHRPGTTLRSSLHDAQVFCDRAGVRTQASILSGPYCVAWDSESHAPTAPTQRLGSAPCGQLILCSGTPWKRNGWYLPTLGAATVPRAAICDAAMRGAAASHLRRCDSRCCWLPSETLRFAVLLLAITTVVCVLGRGEKGERGDPGGSNSGVPSYYYM